MDSEWAHPTDEAAPGFAGSTLVPACSQPDESFLFLAGDTAQSISRQRWEDMAPGMGLADVITAHTTFDQLANEGEGEGKEEEDDDCTISEAVFKKYCGRIHNKARPGETRVGGVETNFGAGCSADEMLAKHPPFRARNMDGLYKRVLKGQFPRIPQKYSNELNHVIKKLLNVTAQNRPNCEQILTS